MKNPVFILTEQRQSNDESPISTIIQQARMAHKSHALVEQDNQAAGMLCAVERIHHATALSSPFQRVQNRRECLTGESSASKAPALVS